jgi:hypothetical protein
VRRPEALEDAQVLLGGSPAIFAARALLAEPEASSGLKAPDMSLLSTTAFVASLMGDTDARGASRAGMEKHRGIFRSVLPVIAAAILIVLFRQPNGSLAVRRDH